MRISDAAASQAELDTPRWAEAAAKGSERQTGIGWGELLRVVRAAASVHAGCFAGKLRGKVVAATDGSYSELPG